MNVYLSTSSFKESDDIFSILDLYRDNGIDSVELGVWTKPIAGGYKEIVRKIKGYGFNLIAHHYFPPHEDEFVLNLASRDKRIRESSTEAIKRSIRFCSDAGAGLFTTHAGFRSDPGMNFNFSKDTKGSSYESAFSVFVDSLGELDAYAGTMGVKMAVENNALAAKNIVNGKNRFLLLCEAFEFERLWKALPSGNLGMLLDLGHTKISSATLGFDRDDFISRIKNKVFCIHINDNDGETDSHGKIGRNSWCLDVMKREDWFGVPVVLEITGLGIDEIKEQAALLVQKEIENVQR